MTGFILCTIPKIHYHILLVSTAFVGASAFMLGVECFTTAGLKEVRPLSRFGMMSFSLYRLVLPLEPRI